MHRTIIQLDEPLYQRLKQLSFEKGISFAAVIRQTLSRALTHRKVRSGLVSFKFIGAGRSTKKTEASRHDDYLTEDFKR